MFQYSNSFSYSYNRDADEVMLSFTQRSPVLNEDGSVASLLSEPVAQILLTRTGLSALRDMLSGINLD